MKVHLFSSPGREGIGDVLDACGPCLKGKPDALIAYLPAGSLSNEWQAYTENAFRGLGRVATINTELQTLPEMEALLRQADLVYLPGGNAYLLTHRLNLCGLMPYLRKKVSAGLPVVAFSAGTVLCGPNILTSNDMNIVPTTYFKGLEASPFNFNVHYPDDLQASQVRDGWLSEYGLFHDNPVVLLSDGAYVTVEKSETRLVRGEAWILRPGWEKQKLEAGAAIQVNPND